MIYHVAHSVQYSAPVLLLPASSSPAQAKCAGHNLPRPSQNSHLLGLAFGTAPHCSTPPHTAVCTGRTNSTSTDAPSCRPNNSTCSTVSRRPWPVAVRVQYFAVSCSRSQWRFPHQACLPHGVRSRRASVFRICRCGGGGRHSYCSVMEW